MSDSGFIAKGLTDVSHYKAWHGWNQRCCSVEARRPFAAAVSSAAQSQSTTRLGSSLSGGNMSVCFAALRADLSDISAVRPLLELSLYCTVGLAHWLAAGGRGAERGVYSPAGNTHQSAVLKWFRWNQPVQIHEIPLQPNPSRCVYDSSGQEGTAASCGRIYSCLHAQHSMLSEG